MNKEERLTEECWRNLDPWECCGQDYYCKRGLREKGGCINGCIVPRNYRRLAKYEDTGLSPAEIKELQKQNAELNAKYDTLYKEYTAQHELLDQYELGCTDRIIVEYFKKVKALEKENAELKARLEKSLPVTIGCDEGKNGDENCCALAYKYKNTIYVIDTFFGENAKAEAEKALKERE